jgi:hypothetical protein
MVLLDVADLISIQKIRFCHENLAIQVNLCGTGRAACCEWEAKEKTVNDTPLSPHSHANEDVGVPRPLRRADVPVGIANGKPTRKP